MKTGRLRRGGPATGGANLPGRVSSYGAIADALQDEYGRGSARRVGTIMAAHGGSVPWYW